jgi:phosphoribosylamine--glycine ligase
MSKLLVIDGDRCGLDICLRAISCGHQVKLFKPPTKDNRDGAGFPGLSITKDLKEAMQWVGRKGFIFPTSNVKYIDELDRWRSIGYRVFGPSKASAQIEINRGLGMEVLRTHDIDVPKYIELSSLQDALNFAWKATVPYVFKPLGSSDDKSLTFTPDDPGQLVEWIRGKMAKGMKLKGPCMLQEKVKMVAEVGIAGYMGSHGFLEDKWELSWEHKKFLSGDYGPSVGESGTVIQLVKKDPLIDILKRFETHFRALKHTGDLAINGGVDSKGRYWPFEFTCRAGWPDDPIRRSLHRSDEVSWMSDALDGKDSLNVSRDCAIGVVVAQRPYPYSDGGPSEVEGNPVYGTDKVSNDVHLMQVMMSKGAVWNGAITKESPLLRTTGPYVMVVTGQGKTVIDAKNCVYKNIDDISLSDMIVRDDIGDTLKSGLPVLNKLGYALDVVQG